MQYAGFKTCLFIQRSLGRFTSAGNGVDRVHLSDVLTASGLLSDLSSATSTIKKKKKERNESEKHSYSSLVR